MSEEAQGLQNPREPLDHEHGAARTLRDSGFVTAPLRRKLTERALTPLAVLEAPRAGLSHFGLALSGADDTLLISGRIGAAQPFAALYRIFADRVVREATTQRECGHRGPCLATDGRRIVVTQPHDSRAFASVYERGGRNVALEATLRPSHDEPLDAQFARRAAIDGELLVLGHSASVAIYRHTAVSWLSTGTLRPQLPYGFNPQFGRALAVLGDHVLVGNPVEIDGHRAGPGRVLVYRQVGERSELVRELESDGIEFGRAQPYELGFGASIHASGGLVAIGAPTELSREGNRRARIYVFRSERGSLLRYARLTVPNCRYGVCLVGDRLLVLGDRLYVYARDGQGFRELASYARAGAEAIASCGHDVIALAHPQLARVSLHRASQLSSAARSSAHDGLPRQT